jgi:hypothetical protein
MIDISKPKYRIDVSKVQEWILSWFLSALVYDEARIAEYVTGILRMKCHFFANSDGSEFFGIVIDEKTGRAWIVYRGTDGYTKLGNLHSWVTNFRIRAGDDGVADGFQDCGDEAFDKVKNYLYHVDVVINTGHSRGSGVSPYEACLCVENMPHLTRVHVDAFANPPTGNQIFADRFNGHVGAGKLTGVRRVLPGDPIATELLRLDIPPVNGVDVGLLTELPKLIQYSIGPAGAVNHSCRMYNASIGVELSNDPGATIEDHRMIGIINDLIVN